jgi:negative regulator of replication initiation
MMPTIRIDDEVWKYLQSRAKPFEDTPNDVLRRELRLAAPNSAAPPTVGTSSRGTFKSDRDYSHARVRGYSFGSKKVKCHSFKEILLSFCNDLRLAEPTMFDRAALLLRGKRRPYFSRTGDGLRLPEALIGRDLFVETNLNANLIVGICRAILEKLGRNPDQLVLDVE